MDFQALYKSKLTTAAEAVKLVKSGDWVDYTRRRRRPLRMAFLALLRHRP